MELESPEDPTGWVSRWLPRKAGRWRWLVAGSSAGAEDHTSPAGQSQGRRISLWQLASGARTPGEAKSAEGAQPLWPGVGSHGVLSAIF